MKASFEDLQTQSYFDRSKKPMIEVSGLDPRFVAHDAEVEQDKLSTSKLSEIPTWLPS
jgi:hypothetical protein